jgi:hypothetical protein
MPSSPLRPPLAATRICGHCGKPKRIKRKARYCDECAEYRKKASKAGYMRRVRGKVDPHPRTVIGRLDRIERMLSELVQRGVSA